MLKVQWPHEECAHEADALRVWDGLGAVRLLAHDFERHALLLEHCKPGICLSSTSGVDPLGVLIGLLPNLWKTTERPMRSLREEAMGWVATLDGDWQNAGRPCERRLIDAAAAFIAELVNDQVEQIRVHQDLHGKNILSAAREPWLAIDPKPLTAEREFSLAPIIRSLEFGHSQAQVLRRLDRLSSELGLDRDRAGRLDEGDVLRLHRATMVFLGLALPPRAERGGGRPVRPSRKSSPRVGEIRPRVGGARPSWSARSPASCREHERPFPAGRWRPMAAPAGRAPASGGRSRTS